MNSDVSKGGNQPVRRKGTPIPVAPPRIPTPMPSNNNNSRSNSKEQDKHYPSSVGNDIPKLITKPSYKVLDNDVKTAWINPRLISKIDMEIIKKTDYSQPSEKNMNGPFRSQHAHQHYQKQQQQQNCGRIHDREWENPVNGRAKHHHSFAPVTALTSSAVDGKRKNRPTTAGKAKMPTENHAVAGSKSHAPGRSKIKPPASNSQHKYASLRNANAAHQAQDRVKGVLGYQQSASACYFDGGATMRGGGVYGVYAETKYVYAVHGMPENQAQASAAAAFFARYSSERKIDVHNDFFGVAGIEIVNQMFFK